MRFEQIEYMRERLSDLSDEAVLALYKSIHNRHVMDSGGILDKECYESIDEHYRENQPRDFGADDEVDRRLQNDEA